MNQTHDRIKLSSRFRFKRAIRSSLFWLVVWYLAVGIVYAWVTPVLEKPDEHGHYGHVLYIRQHHTLAPLVPLSERTSAQFNQADEPGVRASLAFELHQPPLYYVTAALLTSWLPDAPEPDLLFVGNPYFQSAVPVFRNDNRNNFLHPPDTPLLILGARLVSFLFGLGTMLTAYSLAAELFPSVSQMPIAVAAIVGFHPTFLFVSTAISNDAAITFFSALTLLLLVRRARQGPGRPKAGYVSFALPLGIVLGLASITKESGLVLFPLTGLALVLIHRGFRAALFRDGLVIGLGAVVVGGWWYVRNAVLYRDPFLESAHPFTGPGRLLLSQIKYYVLTMEYTFWGNQSITFIKPILFDHVLIWWGRIGLALLVAGMVLRHRFMRDKWQAWILLLCWSATYVGLLIVYWSPKTLTPYGRLIFPALVPLLVLCVYGWYLISPLDWRKFVPLLFGGGMILVGSLTPLITLYPLFHPSREWRASRVSYPVGTVFTDPQSGRPVARLVGYNLSQPYAVPGSYYPVELCWEPLGTTDVPYEVFVQLLDLSHLSDGDSPAAWGRRQTYPGLGNRPTDRWKLHQAFCDPVFIWVFPDAPTPLGAFIEVGFSHPAQGRLQPIDTQGEPIDLSIAGRVPILSTPIKSQRLQTQYTLDSAIGLVQAASSWGDTVTLSLTWQSQSAVTYDATIFVHLRGADGSTVAQADLQPLDGRLPTSLWLPGQILTDTISLPVPANTQGPLELNLGMYTWPSLQRLNILDANGHPQPDNTITLPVPPRPTPANAQ